MNPENVITIDIDERLTPCKFLAYASDCRFILSTINAEVMIDPNGTQVWDSRRGHHIKIPLIQEVEPSKVIELQLFLGSDRKREAYNHRRMQQGKFRSYLFDAKITNESSFVCERNRILEDVWKMVFSLEQHDFETKYKLLMQKKHEKEQKKNGTENLPLDDRNQRETRGRSVQMQDLFARDS